MGVYMRKASICLFVVIALAASFMIYRKAMVDVENDPVTQYSIPELEPHDDQQDAVKLTRFQEVIIHHTDLGKILPGGFLVDCLVSGSDFSNERYLQIVILDMRGSDLKDISPNDYDRLRRTRERVPHLARWEISTTDGMGPLTWLAGFLDNRGERITRVRFPIEKMKRSSLHLVFSYFYMNGERDDLTLIIDMSAYAWDVAHNTQWESTRLIE